MNLKKQSFYIFIIFSLLIIAIQCQSKDEEIEPKVIGSSNNKSTQSNNSSNSSSNSSSNNSSSNSSSNSSNNKTSQSSGNSKSSSNTNTSSGTSSQSTQSNGTNNNNNANEVAKDYAISENNSDLNENSSLMNTTSTESNTSGIYKVEKAKAEKIDTLPIEKEDLSAIRWSEFDHYGFKIAISTPNEFNDDSVINIKWQAVEDMEPSSTIKIELHTNLTRRNDNIAYPTTETIIIDDNIPNNINEINWNPYLKLKKNERYYIRIWAYTNHNTATMSGLCLWSINDLLQDKVTTETTTTKRNIYKTIAFPAVGALLCFTVIGHFVMESRKSKKYRSINNDSSDADSQDGIANRGENIYYDAIKTEGNEGFCTLPQPWELEAKRKHMYNNQSSLSDGSTYQKIGDSQLNYENVILNEARGNNDPITLTIEKPESTMVQKIPKFPVDNPASIRSHHHHHHHHHSSSGSSCDSNVPLL